MVCLFIFLMMYSKEQKVLISIRSRESIFFSITVHAFSVLLNPFAYHKVVKDDRADNREYKADIQPPLFSESNVP